MKNISLHNILCQSARKALEFQDKEGYFPAGHNGPWNDEDTAVRTTAHWAMTIFKAYEITGEEAFLNAAIKACDYLIKNENRPFGYTFFCRKKQPGKNMCNGLIGQAWAIEPLIFIGFALKNDEYLNVAHRIALLHEYNIKYHVWESVEIDGTKCGIVRAINQQIWFASMLSLIGVILKDKVIQKATKDFFINLPSLVNYMGKGLIKHKFKFNISFYEKLKYNVIVNKSDEEQHDLNSIKLLSEGYLSFILYGLALAYEHSAQYYWGKNKLKDIINDAIIFLSCEFPYGCGEKAGYRWSYNPVGIEVAYAIQTFHKYLQIEGVPEIIAVFLNKQFELYYNFENNMLAKNTNDPVVLSSRLYEATRLQNYMLNIPD